MATLGSFSLLIALAFAAYNFFAGAMALWLAASGRPARVAPERLATTARRAGIAAFAAVTAASFALVWAAFTNDFSITYIAEHSNRALPGAYKFAALWSGQEGSLLFWAWLLGLFSFILNLRYKQDTTLYAYAGTIMGVETNSMQFYPEASAPEAQVHPGLYRRRGGVALPDDPDVFVVLGWIQDPRVVPGIRQPLRH